LLRTWPNFQVNPPSDMKRPLILLALLLQMAGMAPVRADFSAGLQGANEALTSGHPIDAVTRYRALTSDPALRGSGAPELWYDLGLAEEKTGDLPAASLSYRRALLLDPTFVPARKMLAGVLVSLGLPAPSGRMESLAAAIHPEILIVTGSIVGWIAVLALILLAFLAPHRKYLIALCVLIVIAGHGASAFGTLFDPRRTAADKAVVTAKKPPVLHATPADNAESGGTLAPGTAVSVLSRNGAWWYVSGGSGLTGWIPADTVTTLLPGSLSGGS